MAEEIKEVKEKEVKLKVLSEEGWGIDGVQYKYGDVIKVGEVLAEHLHSVGKFEVVK